MNNTDSNKEYTPSKVGRHRVFSNEQRKDRNRKAQAAFRDRRSQYTNTLEAALVKCEETISNLKETNIESSKRAQTAEKRSLHLSSQVVSLQRLLEIALADNQRLQGQLAVASVPMNNDMLPLSPNNSSLASDKMSPSNSIDYIFDDVFNNNKDQLELFSTLNSNPITTDPAFYTFTDNTTEFNLDFL